MEQAKIQIFLPECGRLSLRFIILLLSLIVGFSAGCQKTPAPEFRLNAVELLKQERLNLPAGQHFDPSYRLEIGTLLHSLFGTPNEPRFPMFAGDEDPAQDILSLENLGMAAGPVNRDPAGKPGGLYRKHCAQCHGVSGDGRGPTAEFLNPYPRDFRLGKFKFKSTPLRQPPTNQDLRNLLVNGIPGTAMPSFRRLPDAELGALVDYVKYLTIRGQYERYLISELASLDGQPLLDLDLIKVSSAGTAPTEKARAKFADQAFTIVGEGLFEGIVYRWLKLDKKSTPIPPAPAAVAVTDVAHLELVNQGRELFYGKGNCLQCHGAVGMGDGQVGNFDDWTNEWIKTSGVDPNQPATYQEFTAAGVLPPRSIRPRNLHVSMFRGGNHPNDLYLRIANGIEGTPMPSSATLTPDEIWAMVAYVRALPFQQTAVTVKPMNTQTISK